MEYLFIQRGGDKEKITELFHDFQRKTKQELVDYYNRSVEVGIVGVHAQIQRLLALHYTFRIIFGKSPIEIEEKVLIRLSGKIALTGDDWQYDLNSNKK